MYVVKVTNRFKKDVEHCRRRNLDLSKLETIVDLLKEAGQLPARYEPHKLKREICRSMGVPHRTGRLMAWEQNDQQLIILMMQTGTHSDLF
jgi:mRNA interferase YafQ